MGEEKRGGGVGMLHPTLENPEGQKGNRKGHTIHRRVLKPPRLRIVGYLS
jgi:hypothetical protein